MEIGCYQLFSAVLGMSVGFYAVFQNRFSKHLETYQRVYKGLNSWMGDHPVPESEDNAELEFGPNGQYSLTLGTPHLEWISVFGREKSIFLAGFIDLSLSEPGPFELKRLSNALEEYRKSGDWRVENETEPGAPRTRYRGATLGYLSGIMPTLGKAQVFSVLSSLSIMLILVSGLFSIVSATGLGPGWVFVDCMLGGQ